MKRGHKKPAGQVVAENVRGKAEAARSFHCNVNGIHQFTEYDPFNPDVHIQGFVCREEGAFFGSVSISHVNGLQLPVPQIIHGFPTVNNVFKSNQANRNENASSSSNSAENASTSSTSSTGDSKNPWTTLEASSRIFIANKWNGANITAFKYEDALGNQFYSLKPRGHLFLSNRDNLLTIVSNFLKIPLNPSSTKTIVKGGATQLLKSIFPILEQHKIQSVSYELVGSKYPQLVKYNFEMALEPLLATMFDGAIMPQGVISLDLQTIRDWDSININDDSHVLSNDFGPFDFDHTNLASFATQYRARALELNKAYRAANSLHEGYITENFVVEGKVVYLLNDLNCLVSRSSMFKLKPQDTAKYHFEVFDIGLQTATFEAVYKLQTKQISPSPENMFKEMEISEKTFNLFQTNIFNLIKNRPNPVNAHLKTHPKMLVVMGLPGSGKSTVANKLTKVGWFRVNQDEMGNRKACESSARTALAKGQSVVVDRCNFDYDQRTHFLEIAFQAGVLDVRCLWLDTPAEVCKQRVAVRKDHPTIPEGDAGVAIINRFGSSLLPPLAGEGFCQIIRAQTEEEVNAAIESLASLLLKMYSIQD